MYLVFIQHPRSEKREARRKRGEALEKDKRKIHRDRGKNTYGLELVEVVIHSRDLIRARFILFFIFRRHRRRVMYLGICNCDAELPRNTSKTSAYDVFAAPTYERRYVALTKKAGGNENKQDLTYVVKR